MIIGNNTNLFWSFFWIILQYMLVIKNHEFNKECKNLGFSVFRGTTTCIKSIFPQIKKNHAFEIFQWYNNTILHYIDLVLLSNITHGKMVSWLPTVGSPSFLLCLHMGHLHQMEIKKWQKMKKITASKIFFCIFINIGTVDI